MSIMYIGNIQNNPTNDVQIMFLLIKGRMEDEYSSKNEWKVVKFSKIEICKYYANQI